MSENDVAVRAEAGGRLAELLAEFRTASAALKAAEERAEQLKGAIKLLATTAKPAARSIQVQDPDGVAVARVQFIESWRVDATKLKAEHLDIYVQCAKPSRYWKIQGLS